MSKTYYIGWDVGGWSCDKNQNSRDAIVILNEKAEKVGHPWRGNLKALLNEADTCNDLAQGLFQKCKVNSYNKEASLVLAIDTPLAYSKSFIELIAKGKINEDAINVHNENPYLFRRTERFLFENGFRPLSAVQDMLGSQSTKGIHFLAKFGLSITETGVWKKENLTVIETYPTRNREAFGEHYLEGNKDIQDACICARVAYTFSNAPDQLYAPHENVPKEEGWIWWVKNDVHKIKYDDGNMDYRL